MYSTFEHEDIKVTKPKELIEFLLKIKKLDKHGFVSYFYKDFLEGVIDGKQYSFESWNDIKLISYWYDNQVEFLKELGKYIEGYVVFGYETGEERAIIEFDDGKTIIKIGRMKYCNLKPEDLIRKNGKDSI